MTHEEMTKPFPITSVTQEDLKRYFTQAEVEQLSDADMESLASKLADVYCEGPFWENVETIAEVILTIR